MTIKTRVFRPIPAPVQRALTNIAFGGFAALAAGFAGPWLIYLFIAGYLAKEVYQYKHGQSVCDAARDTTFAFIGLIAFIAAPLILSAILISSSAWDFAAARV